VLIVHSKTFVPILSTFPIIIDIISCHELQNSIKNEGAQSPNFKTKQSLCQFQMNIFILYNIGLGWELVVDN
jgi:hypothetical protein